MRKIDLTNKKFNKLTVIKEHSTTRNGHIRWVCVCECGNPCNILGTHLKQGTIKSCGCLVKNNKGLKHHQWKGIGEISGDFWKSHIVRSASGQKGKRSSIELTITKEYIWDLFLKQNRRCALTNIELQFPKITKDKSYTASLDRIDSSKGYIEGNVQWVHKDINIMKNKFNQKYFIDMCKLIANACEVPQ